jgi:hypothetical protein
MIKDISPIGRYIHITSGQQSTYVNGYSGLQGVGNVRYNTSNQNMEVYDGTTWVTLNMGYASVGLNHEAESLLDWAKQKRNEELLLKDRMEKHPGLKEAYERLEIMKALTLEEETKEQK